MNKVLFTTVSFILALILVWPIASVPASVFAQTVGSNTDQNRTVQTTNTSLDVKVAPGELLPVSVKLSNFGGEKRVDVTITYLIVSGKDEEIYHSAETVAVETTNNFVKNIQIPSSAPSGIYTAKTSIIYKGQVTPATTEFTFSVERKILGIYQNELFLYGGISLFLGIALSLIVYKLAKRRYFSRSSPIDYSNIPQNERVFYELISDTVMNMRQKVGDRALEIASSIEGLTIDGGTGRIVKLTRSSSKIIAELVLGYEKVLGEKTSFSFRKP